MYILFIRIILTKLFPFLKLKKNLFTRVPTRAEVAKIFNYLTASACFNKTSNMCANKLSPTDSHANGIFQN